MLTRTASHCAGASLCRVSLFVMACAALGASAAAADEASDQATEGGSAGFGLEATIGFESAYLFRGVHQRDASGSVGVEASYGGLFLGTWAADVGDGAEVDFYGGYGLDLGPLTLTLGGTAYLYTGGFDDPYVEGNLGLEIGPLTIDGAFGQHLTSPEASTYAYAGARVSHAGLHAGGGLHLIDAEGFFAEAGYILTVSDIDLYVNAVWSSKELTGTDDSNVRIVFGIGYSFDLLGD